MLRSQTELLSSDGLLLSVSESEWTLADGETVKSLSESNDLCPPPPARLSLTESAAAAG